MLLQGKQMNLPSVVTTPSRQNKGMTAATTAADGQQATATVLAATPARTANAQGGYIQGRLNGQPIQIGDGTKVAVPSYFSGDGGATARALQNVIAGDKLYWNGTVAGYELDTTLDIIDFVYDVGPT